jgi:hypothetical protein
MSSRLIQGRAIVVGRGSRTTEYFRGGLERCFRVEMARPIDAPSRELAPDHAAHVSSSQPELARENSQPCEAVLLFGSLALPSDEQELLPIANLPRFAIGKGS